MWRFIFCNKKYPQNSPVYEDLKRIRSFIMFHLGVVGLFIGFKILLKPPDHSGNSMADFIIDHRISYTQTWYRIVSLVYGSCNMLIFPGRHINKTKFR